MSPLNWQQVTERLTPRDLAILDDLEDFRLLASRHLQRLHFEVSATRHATSMAATRSCLRVLNKLEGFGVISRLEHRVGGVRAGSQGIVWQLTPIGSRVQQERWGRSGRRRYSEPSTLFVAHTLDVAELAVLVREIERSGRFELVGLESEPRNWRSFTGPHGQPVTLKPDLALVAATGEYEDHWYVEADRATEHLPKILAKCRLYARYAATGIEQQTRKVFPRVLWVTPTDVRARAITGAIATETSLPAELFQAVPADKFAATIAPPEPPP